MRILLTGATGYIAQRLLPLLLNNGHEVICCVRDKSRLYWYNVLPFHEFIFRGMIRNIARITDKL
jgi:nucleoside-diphosphate-sugar epimerase